MGKIYVVGIGPGDDKYMTIEAKEALNNSNVIVGYTVYIDLIRDSYPDTELLSTPMRQERQRCELCLDKAKEGKIVSLVCSGDAGVYGMASLMLEVAQQENIEVEIVAGVTAALSGAALLGAPLGHDFVVISLSDLLTPWETIANRLRCAAKGDYVIVIYNPASHNRPEHLRKACDILLEEIDGNRACGYARNIGRADETYTLCTLSELKCADIDMFTTVFIGNKVTRVIDNRLVTTRGYK